MRTWDERNETSVVLIKVARPGLLLTIPTLFEQEIQRCLKRFRETID